ncbi:MAG: hypothetical protein E7522_02855 [Ruminococcaceae bacterium]|nr:hypothetical protein [Oscillospiraceae bacterium]
MQFKLLGIQPINFTNKNGEVISGTNIYVAYADENVTGLKSDKFFLKEEINLPDCKPNDNLQLAFDMRGRVINIEKV